MRILLLCLLLMTACPPAGAAGFDAAQCEDIAARDAELRRLRADIGETAADVRTMIRTLPADALRRSGVEPAALAALDAIVGLWPRHAPVESLLRLCRAGRSLDAGACRRLAGGTARLQASLTDTAAVTGRLAAITPVADGWQPVLTRLRKSHRRIDHLLARTAAEASRACMRLK